jgi:alpha-mannosidase
LEGDTVTLIAMKKAQKDNSYVLRLFNPTGKAISCRLISEPMQIDKSVSFTPFEVKTLRLSEGALTEWRLTENITE